jgi:hypothetical protein
MNTCGLQEEVDVKFVTPAPTDELLVAEAKSGDHPAFVELWKRHSKNARSIWPIGLQEIETTPRT